MEFARFCDGGAQRVAPVRLAFLAEIENAPELFDASYTRWGPIRWMPPEVFLGLGVHFAARGWRADHIQAVLGGNFRRVAQRTWTS